MALSASPPTEKSSSAFIRKQSPAANDKKELEEKRIAVRNLEHSVREKEAKIIEL